LMTKRIVSPFLTSIFDGENRIVSDMSTATVRDTFARSPGLPKSASPYACAWFPVAAACNDKEAAATKAMIRGVMSIPPLSDAPGIDRIRARSRRMLVPTGVLVIVARQSVADLHDGEHAAHFNRTERTMTGHHRQRVVGKLHFHRTHVGHSFVAH